MTIALYCKDVHVLTRFIYLPKSSFQKNHFTKIFFLCINTKNAIIHLQYRLQPNIFCHHNKIKYHWNASETLKQVPFHFSARRYIIKQPWRRPSCILIKSSVWRRLLDRGTVEREPQLSECHDSWYYLEIMWNKTHTNGRTRRDKTNPNLKPIRDFNYWLLLVIIIVILSFGINHLSFIMVE